jgi:hypothetical protein
MTSSQPPPPPTSLTHPKRRRHRRPPSLCCFWVTALAPRPSPSPFIACGSPGGATPAPPAAITRSAFRGAGSVAPTAACHRPAPRCRRVDHAGVMPASYPNHAHVNTCGFPPWRTGKHHFHCLWGLISLGMVYY